MPSDLLMLLYRGDRPAAVLLARERDLDIFEAAALGALEALIERCEEDASRVNARADDGWTPLHLAMPSLTPARRAATSRRSTAPAPAIIRRSSPCSSSPAPT
jgi:hypothetical protein